MNDKVSIVKMQKIVISKVELAKAIIAMATCFSGIHLSDTEMTVLAYFMVYGINPQSKTLIVKSSVCKNLANIKTIMVKLKKLELIYKDEFNSKVYITKALNIELTPNIALYFKIENKT